MERVALGFYKFSVWITRLAYLNILWIAFTIVGLGIFGIMPATIAMFSVARKWIVMDEQDTPIFKTFWNTYRNDFVKANGIGLPLFSIVYLEVVAFIILFNHEETIYNVAAFGVVAIFILIAIVLAYLFPIYVHFDLKIIDYFKWSFIIGIIHPILTAVMLIGVAAIYYVLLYFFTPIFLIFGASIMAYIFTLGASKVFYKYEKEEN